MLCRSFAGHRGDTPPRDEEIVKLAAEAKKHPEAETFQGEHNLERPKGKIYDKKPFKVFLEADKRYSWCTCGHSKKQVCDLVQVVFSTL